MLEGVFCTVDINQSVMTITKDDLPVERKGRAMSLDVEDTLCFTVDVHWPVTIITRRSMDLPPRRLITLPLQTAFRDWLSCMVVMSDGNRSKLTDTPGILHLGHRFRMFSYVLTVFRSGVSL